MRFCATRCVAHAKPFSTQVEDADGLQLLVRMPQRFNKMLWVKRGARAAAAPAARCSSEDAG